MTLNVKKGLSYRSALPWEALSNQRKSADVKYFVTFNIIGNYTKQKNIQNSAWLSTLQSLLSKSLGMKVKSPLMPFT